ncbi:GvpL/GvpF family gas vesicle protein [Streptomyces mirabilis]|uniref:GvpL/GvpF family gas vesicle protein n=1 Tax=Streptomyces mirabilis TaxID=68239 RepID=UPI0022562834|nr:GvpL/GvpF family gas vesicle protein [Streptomyces mirabilis]MCX4419363.1 GvpL/GvpF family gas vesicle protein [Streptomyces mirabilis]
MSDTELRYVYAVGRDERALERLAGLLTGVDGHPLHMVSGNGLAALVSAVPADRFDETSLTAQLEDLGRLESLARAHHAVVDAAFAQTTVLPMRLATVYRDETRVADMLDEQRPQFDEMLDLLDGHVELGLKVYSLPHAVPAPAEPEPDAASPGRAYLRRRRAQRDTAQHAHRVAIDLAEAAALEADALSTARMVHRPQQGEWSAGRGENVVNEAYLVPLDAVEQFRARLSALARPGVGIEVTGPWAPYSFATQPVRDRAEGRGPA